MTEPLSNDQVLTRLRVARRIINTVLALIVGVALRALSPPEYLFVAGWIGGATFALVYWDAWESR